MDTLRLVFLMVGCFVLLPLGVGFLVARRTAGYAAWVALVAATAVSQSTDDELGNFWILVVAVGLAALPLVLLGTLARSQLTERRASNSPAD